MVHFETLNYDVKNRVAVITLNRPKAANGLNLKMAAELASVAKQCREDVSVRAVILTGAGAFFCAGGDIKAMASFGDDVSSKIKTLADDLHDAISIFSKSDVPVICAVNGIAAGAGFSLAMSADIVIANRDAKFVMAYTRAGLSPDGSSTYFLPRLIGLRKTQELMLLNTQLSATEAYDWGLITRVASSDDLMPCASKIASSLANGPAGAIRAAKHLLSLSYGNDLVTQMELEGQAISYCAGSFDGREGITAFIEKRKPNFE